MVGTIPNDEAGTITDNGLSNTDHAISSDRQGMTTTTTTTTRYGIRVKCVPGGILIEYFIRLVKRSNALIAFPTKQP